MKKVRRIPAHKLDNAELLSQYRSLYAWFCDGFSLSSPTRHDHTRCAVLEAEILKRMGKPA